MDISKARRYAIVFNIATAAWLFSECIDVEDIAKC